MPTERTNTPSKKKLPKKGSGFLLADIEKPPSRPQMLLDAELARLIFEVLDQRDPPKLEQSDRLRQIEMAWSFHNSDARKEDIEYDLWLKTKIDLVEEENNKEVGDILFEEEMERAKNEDINELFKSYKKEELKNKKELEEIEASEDWENPDMREFYYCNPRKKYVEQEIEDFDDAFNREEILRDHRKNARGQRRRDAKQKKNTKHLLSANHYHHKNVEYKYNVYFDYRKAQKYLTGFVGMRWNDVYSILAGRISEPQRRAEFTRYFKDKIVVSGKPKSSRITTDFTIDENGILRLAEHTSSHGLLPEDGDLSKEESKTFLAGRKVRENGAGEVYWLERVKREPPTVWQNGTFCEVHVKTKTFGPARSHEHKFYRQGNKLTPEEISTWRRVPKKYQNDALHVTKACDAR